MITIEVAYIAGLFDGEGNVRLRFRERDKIGRSNGKSYKHHQKEYELSASIANKNLDCLNFCRLRYGGRIYKQLRQPKENWTPIYRWMIQGKAVLSFLTEIREYAIVKKPHIEAILNNPEDKAYASRLLRVFNKRGLVEHPKIPLI